MDKPKLNATVFQLKKKVINLLLQQVGPIYHVLGDVQFQIMFRGSLSSNKICLTVPEDLSKPVIKLPCQHVESDDGHQLFKWKLRSNQILHPASDRCLQGSDDTWSTVAYNI